MVMLKESYCKSKRENILKYLAVKLAPIIFGVKPSVLLTLKDSQRSGGRDLFTFYMQNQEYIRRTLNIEVFELKNCGHCAKVIFFKRKLLTNTLYDKRRNLYLSKFGYSKCCKLEDFLITLKERFNSKNGLECTLRRGVSNFSRNNQLKSKESLISENNSDCPRQLSFPHEIGIFLGYPLKDVLGFVQCPEKYRKVGRTPWKIFGNAELSLKMIERHKEAENSMKLIFRNVVMG